MAEEVGRTKQTENHRYPMFGEIQFDTRIKSRKPFMEISEPITELQVLALIRIRNDRNELLIRIQTQYRDIR